MSIGRRPLLGALSLLPLAGAGAVALSSHGSPGLGELLSTEETAAPGALTLYAPGPLTVPADMLGSGTSDSGFAIEPPSTEIDVTALALEGDSSLLFGRVSTSTTLQDSQGNPLAPSISLTGEDGTDDLAPPTELGLGAVGLIAEGIEGAAQVSLAAADGGRPVEDAVQMTVTTTGDFRSLSLARLGAPVVDASFLGAGTLTGSTTELVLRNASSRPATASVQVWTADGPAEMQGRSRIVVAAGEEQQLLLDTVAPRQDAVGLRIVSVGAPLLLHVSTAERDGLAPRGAEILSPLPAAGTDQLIPGVHLGEGGPVPVLVLQNPGGTDTSVDVSVLGPEGDLGLSGLTGLDLPAGTVLTVPLPLAAPGDAAVRVVSADAVDAVVRSRVLGPASQGGTVGQQTDLAIAQAAPALTGGTVLALPAVGAFGLLAMVATEDTTATVIPVGSDGSGGTVIELDVPSGRLVTVPAASLAGTGGDLVGLALTPGGSGILHAAWVQVEHDPALGGLISTVPVEPVRRESAALAVHLG